MCYQFTRPPSISPLFPYTTLFRSEQVLVPCGAEHQLAAQRLPDGLGVFADRVARDDRAELLPVGAFFQCFRDDDVEDLDRKSTRLNSSHLVSSYAVSCLKKKSEGG